MYWKSYFATFQTVIYSLWWEENKQANGQGKKTLKHQVYCRSSFRMKCLAISEKIFLRLRNHIYFCKLSISLNVCFLTVMFSLITFSMKKTSFQPRGMLNMMLLHFPSLSSQIWAFLLHIFVSHLFLFVSRKVASFNTYQIIMRSNST